MWSAVRCIPVRLATYYNMRHLGMPPSTSPFYVCSDDFVSSSRSTKQTSLHDARLFYTNIVNTNSMSMHATNTSQWCTVYRQLCWLLQSWPMALEIWSRLAAARHSLLIFPNMINVCTIVARWRKCICFHVFAREEVTTATVNSPSISFAMLFVFLLVKMSLWYHCTQIIHKTRLSDKCKTCNSLYKHFFLKCE